MSTPFYIVRIDCGRHGLDLVERASRDVLIQDLIAGQIEDPFQILECEIGGMCIDVSEDIARSVADKAQRDPIPQALVNFVHDNASPALARELRSAA
jgi:hypothetical protein